MCELWGGSPTHILRSSTPAKEIFTGGMIVIWAIPCFAIQPSSSASNIARSLSAHSSAPASTRNGQGSGLGNIPSEYSAVSSAMAAKLIVICCSICSTTAIAFGEAIACGTSPANNDNQSIVCINKKQSSSVASAPTIGCMLPMRMPQHAGPTASPPELDVDIFYSLRNSQNLMLWVAIVYKYLFFKNALLARFDQIPFEFKFNVIEDSMAIACGTTDLFNTQIAGNF